MHAFNLNSDDLNKSVPTSPVPTLTYRSFNTHFTQLAITEQ